MRSINRTLITSLSLGASAIFILAVMIVATVQVTRWDPDLNCRTAISIVSRALTEKPGTDLPLTISDTTDFAAMNANSPKLWLSVSTGTDSLEFSRNRRPQLPFEIPYKGSTTSAFLADRATEQSVCLEHIKTPAAKHAVLVISGAEPGFLMLSKQFFGDALPSFAMVGAAFAAVVALGVFLAGRFVKRSIERVTRMAVAIDPAAPQGSISLEDVPSELQVLVRSLNGAFDEIATFMERQRRFLSNVAHELRTPLAILRTKVEGVTDSKLRATLILDTRRLTSLVTAMLDLSRLKAAGLQRTPVDLTEVTRDVLADYSPLALDQGTDLSLVSECEAPIVVLGSSEAIRSAIANLVGNALVHAYGAKKIVARLHREGAVSISDDGVAVSHEQTPRLSSPPTSAALRQAGTGLGLSIVREIMAAHQGSARITTGPNGGTTVRLTFDDHSTSGSFFN